MCLVWKNRIKFLNDDYIKKCFISKVNTPKVNASKEFDHFDLCLFMPGVSISAHYDRVTIIGWRGYISGHEFIRDGF